MHSRWFYVHSCPIMCNHGNAGTYVIMGVGLMWKTEPPQCVKPPTKSTPTYAHAFAPDSAIPKQDLLKSRSRSTSWNTRPRTKPRGSLNASPSAYEASAKQAKCISLVTFDPPDIQRQGGDYAYITNVSSIEHCAAQVDLAIIKCSKNTTVEFEIRN